MRRLLCTIGFTGKTAEEFFVLLRQAGVESVIDVRQNRGGQLSAFAKYPDLAYFLKQIAGIGYKHEPLLAPTPELRKGYQHDKDWPAYEMSFLALLKQRHVPQALDTTAWPAKVALLCTEPGPEKCHRRLVANLLAEQWRAAGDEVELRHLIANSRVGSEARKAASGSEGGRDLLSIRSSRNTNIDVAIVGWAAVRGSRKVPSDEVDQAFGMPAGKLRNRAGIESLAYAADDQSELTLGAEAMQQALQVAGGHAKDIDWIIATSESHREYPSLAAQLHKRLNVRESCGALDVGGACLGLLNGLAVAQSFIESGQARTVAIVTADVHSRTLTPGRVAGEFGGLFGDGASAFMLRATSEGQKADGYRLGRFFFGCASQYSEAICVSEAQDSGLTVQFDGEALSRAATTRMERVLAMVETQSGISRADVGFFATHQPNPRLVMLLAKQCKVPPDAFPDVARTSGNLGSSTCGVALDAALQAALKMALSRRKPIFLVSLGPGLLFGGGWLNVHNERNSPGL